MKKVIVLGQESISQQKLRELLPGLNTDEMINLSLEFARLTTICESITAEIQKLGLVGNEISFLQPKKILKRNAIPPNFYKNKALKNF